MHKYIFQSRKFNFHKLQNIFSLDKNILGLFKPWRKRRNLTTRRITTTTTKSILRPLLQYLLAVKKGHATFLQLFAIEFQGYFKKQDFWAKVTFSDREKDYRRQCTDDKTISSQSTHFGCEDLKNKTARKFSSRSRANAFNFKSYQILAVFSQIFPNIYFSKISN